MVEEVARLSRLLNELLDAGRHAPEPPRQIRLAEVVDDILALTRCQLTPEIRLESRVDPTLTCRLPQDRLRQALLNLVLNAAGALGAAGGEIVVDAATTGPGKLRITVDRQRPRISPPSCSTPASGPFFSTRERGTGLGLAMVRRFARDLGGTIELANREPRGAQVTLHPARRRRVAATSRSPWRVELAPVARSVSRLRRRPCGPPWRPDRSPLRRFDALVELHLDLQRQQVADVGVVDRDGAVVLDRNGGDLDRRIALRLERRGAGEDPVERSRSYTSMPKWSPGDARVGSSPPTR